MKVCGKCGGGGRLEWARGYPFGRPDSLIGHRVRLPESV